MIDPKNEKTWNFSLCPPEEEDLCYYYEYMWEIEWLRQEFAAFRRRHPDMAELASSGDVPNWQNWTEHLMRKRPRRLQGIGGTYFSLLVVFADFFPERHWLEIPEEDRVQRRSAVFNWRPVMDISNLQFGALQIALANANSQSGQLTFGEALRLGLSPAQSHLANRTHSFWVNWKVAPDRIKRAFAEWVDAYVAQLDELYPKRGVTSLTGLNTSADWLKFLAAMRLMNACDQDWQRCTEFRCWYERKKSLGRRKSRAGRERRARPIYTRSTEWTDAAKSAVSHIRKLAEMFALRSAEAQGG